MEALKSFFRKKSTADIKNEECVTVDKHVYTGSNRKSNLLSENVIHGVIDESECNHEKITILVIGAGMRGNTYAQYAKDFPNRMQVVGIAEPKKIRRETFKNRFSIDNDYCFSDWKEATKTEKFADAVVIATLDDMHYAPCLAFADLGYHILCEKPMAPTEQECAEMVDVAKRNNVMLAFGHVMRYTNEYLTVKKLITEGRLGDVIGIQHMEPVGWWHFAHSYVRGNWKKEIKECGSLMAKSCHDLGLIKYFMGDVKCKKIQSFGSLTHFKPENKPTDASSRCLDCKIERSCPYSAIRQYIDPIKTFGPDGFCYAVCEEPTLENMTDALRTGPYGRCVYESDNDVCDYQTVNMEFEGGKYVTFTMTAFTKDVCQRKIRIMGTKGQIECDGNKFKLFDFVEEKTLEFRATSPKECSNMPGHGFADYYLMKEFVKAVAMNDPSLIKSGPEDSLRSHQFVFAAEKSRKNGGIMLEVDI